MQNISQTYVGQAAFANPETYYLKINNRYLAICQNRHQLGLLRLRCGIRIINIHLKQKFIWQKCYVGPFIDILSH